MEVVLSVNYRGITKEFIQTGTSFLQDGLNVLLQKLNPHGGSDFSKVNRELHLQYQVKYIIKKSPIPYWGSGEGELDFSNLYSAHYDEKEHP
jgi:hypothetical protein